MDEDITLQAQDGEVNQSSEEEEEEEQPEEEEEEEQPEEEEEEEQEQQPEDSESNPGAGYVGDAPVGVPQPGDKNVVIGRDGYPRRNDAPSVADAYGGDVNENSHSLV